MNAQITLSDTHTAITEQSRYSTFKPDMPVIVVLENGRRTPGQWYADTIAASGNDEIYIDFGANWKLNATESALLKGFAMGVVAAVRKQVAEVTTPEHTVRGGKNARIYGGYGITHDMDCPGCKDTPYTSSPRSETYWAS